MSLHDDIKFQLKHQLKVIATSRAVITKAETRSANARSMIKNAEERIAALVDQLTAVSDHLPICESVGSLPPLPSANDPPLDPAEHQRNLKLLRRVGYEPKVTRR